MGTAACDTSHYVCTSRPPALASFLQGPGAAARQGTGPSTPAAAAPQRKGPQQLLSAFMQKEKTVHTPPIDAATAYQSSPPEAGEVNSGNHNKLMQLRTASACFWQAQISCRPQFMHCG